MVSHADVPEILAKHIPRIAAHVPLRAKMQGHKATVGSLADPILMGYLQAIGWIPYAACILATAAISVITLLITSDVTPIGRHIYKFLLTQGSRFDQACGFKMYEGCFGLGVAMLGVGLLVDVNRWTAKKAQSIYYIVSGVFLLFGLFFYTEIAPSMPIIIGVVATILALVAVQKNLLWDAKASEFSFACAVSLILVSGIFLIVWIAWALTPALNGRHYASDIGKFFNESINLSAFILWASPLLLSGAYFILGVFALVRGRAHIAYQRNAESPQAQAETDQERDNVYVLQELKFVMIILTIAVFFSWVAASIAAHDIGLSRTVLRLSFVLYVGTCMYVFTVLGPKRIMAAVEEQEAFQMIVDFAQSDWMKGITLLVAWPLVPVFFLFEILHQFVRNHLAREGIVDVEVERHLLTREARAQWDRMLTWEWGSVLTKSIYAAMAYFLLQVGISTGMTMFLSWLSEQVSTWPLLAVLATLFAVGISLFLLPPVPGLPIYLISGIVVVQKLEDTGFSFAVGCILATLFCFMIKMVANVILQKCIGEIFSDNLTVRKNVQVHTPTMKAVEWILSAKGLDPAKVSVLVGGPDWPTAVMTGILKIRVLDMLAGSVPCFFVILPVVLSAAFTLKAGEAAANPAESREGTYRALASVMITLSAVVQMGSMVLAGIYIQAVKDKYKDEFAETREEDVQVIDAIEQSAQESLEYKNATSWDLVPSWLRCVSFMGSFLANTMMMIVLFVEAFQDFSITDSIGDPPLNGHPLDIILNPGWLAIASLAGSCICLSIYFTWCGMQVKRNKNMAARKKGLDEETPLLSKAGGAIVKKD